MNKFGHYQQGQSEVLICSADEKLNKQLQACVCHIGARPIFADTEQVAFESLRGTNIDLVLIDETFSNSDGFAFIRTLQRGGANAGLPVIMITENGNAETVERAYRNGAMDYLAKPLENAIVGHKLNHLINAHRNRKEIEAQQNYLNKYDPLTGLYNRQFFSQKLQRSLEKTQENQNVSALMLIDIDNFKRINNTFNYQYGDGLLQQVANRLSASLRGTDLLMRDPYASLPEQGLARLGGDEFTLFIEDIGDVENAITVANRCIEAISQPLNLQGQNVVLSASVGIAIYPLDGQNVDVLMKNAERAMYTAKERGGACYTCYRQEMNLADESSFILENDLRDALANDQLTLHYQPQIDGVSGDVTSVEVLCRWNHPFLGMVPPDRFIPIAESSGLIVPIGDWVMETACVQAKKWLDEGRELTRVAVNVSAYQFYRDDFIEKTLGILSSSGLSAKYLELELTESLIMSDAEENIAKLNELKGHGISLAVDDFGTGYSSLAYLKRLPIDTLKIDRSFVSNIKVGSADGAIVGAILALAGKLNLQVVAEGVEDGDQLSFLRENNCALLQGYYFSAAKPVEEVTELIGKPLYNQSDVDQIAGVMESQSSAA